MQAFPEAFHKKLSVLFGKRLIKSFDNRENDKNIIEENTRVNFKFNKEKYLAFKASVNFNGYQILRTDKEMFENMNGSVVPKCFWRDAAQFNALGVGFSLMYEDKIASTAYSSFINDRQLEIGIETNEKYRGKGFAINTCSALIDYSIENNFEPVWSCRLENTGSYLLAQKLGFEPTLYLPFYRLTN